MKIKELKTQEYKTIANEKLKIKENIQTKSSFPQEFRKENF